MDRSIQITAFLQYFLFEIEVRPCVEIISEKTKLYKFYRSLFRFSRVKSLLSFQSLYQILPRTAFLRSTAGSATKCFRAHWRFVLTTPTCCCPGGDRGVSTDRDRMAASPSVSQVPGPRQREWLSGCLSSSLLQPGLIPFSYTPPPSFIQCLGDNNLTWLHLH